MSPEVSLAINIDQELLLKTINLNFEQRIREEKTLSNFFSISIYYRGYLYVSLVQYIESYIFSPLFFFFSICFIFTCIYYFLFFFLHESWLYMCYIYIYACIYWVGVRRINFPGSPTMYNQCHAQRYYIFHYLLPPRPTFRLWFFCFLFSLRLFSFSFSAPPRSATNPYYFCGKTPSRFMGDFCNIFQRRLRCSISIPNSRMDLTPVILIWPEALSRPRHRCRHHLCHRHRRHRQRLRP